MMDYSTNVKQKVGIHKFRDKDIEDIEALKLGRTPNNMTPFKSVEKRGGLDEPVSGSETNFNLPRPANCTLREAMKILHFAAQIQHKHWSVVLNARKTREFKESTNFDLLVQQCKGTEEDFQQ